MLVTTIISFREFFEAFLIVGIFLGISKNLHLKKEREIALAAALGIALSLAGAGCVYFFAEHARILLTEENADFLENYLLVFSGIFIAYVIYALHDLLNKNKFKNLNEARRRLEAGAFKVSLFLTILFLILREGFEIALFTASASPLSAFAQNIAGLIIGLLLASAAGALSYLASSVISTQKIFKTTEYLIILLGAALTQLGITRILETQTTLRLSDIGPLHLQFLPNEDTFFGHVLQGLLGVDGEFSLARLGLMGAYGACIYLLFHRYLPGKKSASV